MAGGARISVTPAATVDRWPRVWRPQAWRCSLAGGAFFPGALQPGIPGALGVLHPCWQAAWPLRNATSRSWVLGLGVHPTLTGALSGPARVSRRGHPNSSATSPGKRWRTLVWRSHPTHRADTDPAEKHQGSSSATTYVIWRGFCSPELKGAVYPGPAAVASLFEPWMLRTAAHHR